MSDIAAPAVAPVVAPSASAPPGAPAGAPAHGEPPSAKPHGGTVLRGLVWIGTARWVAQLFTWASTLLIARLLAPEDYGLVAMASVLTGFLEIVTDLGLGSALVQKQGLTKREVEGAMGMTCLLGLGAATIIALAAPLWGRVQGDPRVVPLVQTLALGIVLTVSANVPYSMLHRRLAFGMVARAQFVRGLVTAVTTLGGAFLIQSHWALVIGYLVGRASFTAMLVWAEPVRPRMPEAGGGVRSLLRFGGILTADRILNYARMNTDVALVGAMLGSHMVGLYVMAIALARLPLEKLGSAFEPVAYPTFARLRDDPPELRRFFLNFSLGTMAIAVPACFGLILTAQLLVPTILGSQWTNVVRPLQIAALMVPLEFHLGISSALLNAKGRVDLSLRITTLTSTMTVAAVMLGVRFGIVGVATATTLAYASVWIYGETLTLRMAGLRWRDFAGAVLPALSASVGMAVCVFAVSRALPASWPAPIRLVLECGTGVVTFAGWAYWLHGSTVVPQLRGLRAAWSARS